jgi:CheY-specific phosphatase CheX
MRPSELAGIIPECCSEVFDAMYFTSVLGVVSAESVLDVPPETNGALTFGLRFAGNISGRFGLQVEHAAARTLAANFLGETDSDISSSEVSEVIGELTNMLCGAVMSRLEGENSFALSHPEPGASMPTGAGDMLVSMLETESGIITIWILIEGNSCPS